MSIIKIKINPQKSTYMSGNNIVTAGQLTEKQLAFVEHLVKEGKNPTEAARQAGYASPKQNAYLLTRNPKIGAAIRQARQTLYQTDLANLAAGTLRQVMQDQDAPAAARVTAARTALELSGDLDRGGADGSTRALSEMTPEQLAELIDKWEGEKIRLARDVTPQGSAESIAN